MDLLRFTTAGSVDDGKSTLIGRLLYDSQSVYEDQLTSVRKATRNQATKGLDLSLLTDGLRAEREQGITIDVAYRYFSTPRRKFIIADTPGHEQYTRNMATGASTADLAVILIDARYGVLPQSRRHAYIARLLGIPRLVVAVNKMDLVGFREEVFTRIQADFDAFLASILSGAGLLACQSERSSDAPIAPVQYIPLSALDGDNVVRRSDRTPWYQGPSLLEHLETVPLIANRRNAPFRFPVQYVIRPDLNFRGFAGQIVSGSIRRGDQIQVLPSGRMGQLKSIVTFDGELEEAYAPMSVTLQLTEEIDVSRGDLLAAPADAPSLGRRFDATVVWMSTRPLQTSRAYLLKHGTQTAPARVTGILHRTDINRMTPEAAEELRLNEIGEVRMESQRTLCFDPYDRIRQTGAFVLIDPVTHETAGAGMILGGTGDSPVLCDSGPVTEAERRSRVGHGAFLVILPAGGEAYAQALEREFFSAGLSVYFFEKEQVTSGLAASALRLGMGVIGCFDTADLTVLAPLCSLESAFTINQQFTCDNSPSLGAKKLLDNIRKLLKVNVLAG